MNPAATNLHSPPPKKKKKKSYALWIVLGAVALVVVLAVVAKRSGKGKQGDPVTVEKAFIKTITQVVTATGKVQPEVEVKISPEVGGELIALPFKEGATVKKGDTIVKIKPDTYKAGVEQAEANLSAARAGAVQAQAQLVKAQEDFKRSEDLYAKHLISDSEYVAAKTAADVAKANAEDAVAQIRSREGLLNQAKDLLSKTTIYAPMDGTVSAKESEVGERVIGGGQFAGTEIMRVADLDHMELRVKVNENDIVNVKVGDHTVISIDAYPNRKFSGTVREISSSALNSGSAGSGSAAQASASVSDEVTNFLVKIRIADRDVHLRPGMSATADIETQTVKDAVAVPIQSVTVRAAGGLTSEELQQKRAKEAMEKSGNELEVKDEREEARRNRDKLERVIFVVHGDTVKLEKVVTGIADDTDIEIKSGVKPGDEVVSGSYAEISRKLKDGMKVHVEKPKKPDDKK